jgi:hypothetical protein
VENHGVVDQNTEQFQGLRELAKRFALSFGVDNIKNREPLAMIHHVNKFEGPNNIWKCAVAFRTGSSLP